MKRFHAISAVQVERGERLERFHLHLMKDQLKIKRRKVRVAVSVDKNGVRIKLRVLFNAKFYTFTMHGTIVILFYDFLHAIAKYFDKYIN